MTPDDLRMRRESLRLTQKQLAELLGVSKSTVSHWEIGEQKIPRYLDLALQTLELERLRRDNNGNERRSCVYPYARRVDV